MVLTMIGMTTSAWAGPFGPVVPPVGDALTVTNTDIDVGKTAATIPDCGLANSATDANLLMNNTNTVMTSLNVGIGLIPRDHRIVEHAIYRPVGSNASKNTLLTTVKFSATGSGGVNMLNVGSGALKPDIEENIRASAALNMLKTSGTTRDYTVTATSTEPNRHPLQL